MKNALGIGLIIADILQYTFPEFNEIFREPVLTSNEHRELVGMIMFIGGLILFYMPSNTNKN